jgi:capsular exopolysaccharide synthesis family protein
MRATPIYTAKASAFVSLPSGNTAGELSQGVNFTQELMASFADLATRPVVMEKVIDELDLNTTPAKLARSVRARVSGGTVILEVLASSPSRQRAAAIANSVVANLDTVVRQVSPQRDDGRSTVEITPVGEATPPLYQSAPNTRRNVVAALLAGGLLGVAVAFARDRLDTRLRTSEDVSSRTSSPVLAELAETSDLKADVVAMRDRPLGTASEQFRRLRANLDFLRVARKPLALVITSAEAGEGKSSVALNLAVACAQGGDRVVLVDGDMRKPSLAGRLGLDSSLGLSTVLSGRSGLDDSLQSAGRGPGIDVITSGPVPPNPADLLDSPAMSDLLDELLLRYDVVMLDSPPVLPVVDAGVLGRQVAGALLVVRANRTRRESLDKAIVSLEQVGAKVLGTVVNGIAGSTAGHYYYAPKGGSDLPAAAKAPVPQDNAP